MIEGTQSINRQNAVGRATATTLVPPDSNLVFLEILKGAEVPSPVIRFADRHQTAALEIRDVGLEVRDADGNRDIWRSWFRSGRKRMNSQVEIARLRS